MSTKKQRAEFRQKAEELIKKYGGESSLGHYSSYEWLMETRYGLLRLIVENEEVMGFARKYLGIVFTRFNKSPPPHLETDCNPYSGKWNFHFHDSHIVEQAIGVLEGQFEKIAVESA